MRQTLAHLQPQIGIESKHLLQQVQSKRIRVGENVPEALPTSFGDAPYKLKGLLIADVADVVVLGRPQNGYDSLDLVEIVVARKQGGSAEEFCEDTTDAPDINRFCVLGGV